MSLPSQALVSWRPMMPADVEAAFRLSQVAHPDLPEDEAVFHDRLAVFAPGCLVLGFSSGIGGYALSHPWHFGPPPRLNRRLGTLPAAPDTFYIHDVVLAPEWRGRGFATGGVDRLLNEAEAYPSACLVSVYGTAPFWSRFRFEDRTTILSAGALAGYGEDARFMVRPAGG